LSSKPWVSLFKAWVNTGKTWVNHGFGDPTLDFSSKSEKKTYVKLISFQETQDSIRAPATGFDRKLPWNDMLPGIGDVQSF
jgi:hypothetical protein